MRKEGERCQTILLLHDVDETRDLMEAMLCNNGQHVVASRSEEDAISRARTTPPDVIVMSLGLEPKQHREIGERVRKDSGLSANVALVLFCDATIPEGAEVAMDENIYATYPDNFDQLRGLLHRLLCEHHHRFTC